MRDIFSLAPEEVRLQTSLAPLLLDTQALTTDVLARALGAPVRVKVLRHEKDSVGFVRVGLLGTADFALCLSTTVIFPLRKTRALVETVKKDPAMLFGDALKKHKLYHHKTEPRIRRTVYLPEYREMFGVDGGITEVWERTYAIACRKGERIAGVTEIFSPRVEKVFENLPEHEVIPPPPAETVAPEARA